MNLGYIMIVTSMLIWGSVGLFVRGIEQPPEVIVFFRVTIALVTLLAYNKYKGRAGLKVYDRKNRWLLVAGGLCLALNWMFFFKGLKSTTIASATMSYYTAPVIVTLLSIVLLKEKVAFQTLLAVLLSFLGIGVILMGSGQAGVGIDFTGIIYSLIAAVFYAMVTIIGKKLEGVSAQMNVMIQTAVASLLFLPTIKWMLPMNTKSIILLLILGIVHTSFALTLYFEGIKRIKVQHVGVLSYIDPLSAVLFGSLFFGEIPTVHTVIGGAMILIATYIIIKPPKGSYNTPKSIKE